MEEKPAPLAVVGDLIFVGDGTNVAILRGSRVLATFDEHAAIEHIIPCGPNEVFFLTDGGKAGSIRALPDVCSGKGESAEIANLAAQPKSGLAEVPRIDLPLVTRFMFRRKVAGCLHKTIGGNEHFVLGDKFGDIAVRDRAELAFYSRQLLKEFRQVHLREKVNDATFIATNGPLLSRFDDEGNPIGASMTFPDEAPSMENQQDQGNPRRRCRYDTASSDRCNIEEGARSRDDENSSPVNRDNGGLQSEAQRGTMLDGTPPEIADTMVEPEANRKGQRCPSGLETLQREREEMLSWSLSCHLASLVALRLVEIFGQHILLSADCEGAIHVARFPQVYIVESVLFAPSHAIADIAAVPNVPVVFCIGRDRVLTMWDMFSGVQLLTFKLDHVISDVLLDSKPLKVVPKLIWSDPSRLPVRGTEWFELLIFFCGLPVAVKLELDYNRVSTVQTTSLSEVPGAILWDEKLGTVYLGRSTKSLYRLEGSESSLIAKMVAFLPEDRPLLAETTNNPLLD